MTPLPDRSRVSQAVGLEGPRAWACCLENSRSADSPPSSRTLQVHHGLVQCKHHGRFDEVSVGPEVSVGAIQALGQSELRRHYSKHQQTRLDPNVTRNDVQQCNVATMPVDEDEPAEPGRSHGAPDVTTDTKQCVCGKRHRSDKAQMLNRPPIAQSGKDPNFGTIVARASSQNRVRVTRLCRRLSQPAGAVRVVRSIRSAGRQPRGPSPDQRSGSELSLASSCDRQTPLPFERAIPSHSRLFCCSCCPLPSRPLGPGVVVPNQDAVVSRDRSGCERSLS